MTLSVTVFGCDPHKQNAYSAVPMRWTRTGSLPIEMGRYPAMRDSVVKEHLHLISPPYYVNNEKSPQ